MRDGRPEAGPGRAGYRQDWDVNSGSRHIQVMLALYRAVSQGVGGRPLFLLYDVLSRMLLHIEIPAAARIGTRLRVFHGHGLVLHPAAVLGDDCVLRQGVTVGNRGSARDDEVPVIGDRVEFGANAQVLGAVRVGDDAVIGAGAVVLHDVPPGTAVAGIPARPVGPARRPSRSGTATGADAS